MINTYNLQFGMQTLLGDMVNQLAMFIVVTFFVRPATDPCPGDGDLSSEIYRI